MCRIAKLRAEEDICSNWWCTKLEKANNRLDSGLYLKRCVASRSGPTCVYISVFKWRRFLKKIGKKSLCQLFFDVPLQWLYCSVALFGFRLTIFFGLSLSHETIFCSIFSFSGLWIIKLGHVLSHKNDLSCERVPWDVVHLLT